MATHEIYRRSTGLMAAALSYAHPHDPLCDGEDLLQDAVVRTLQSGRGLQPPLVRTAMRTASIDRGRRRVRTIGGGQPGCGRTPSRAALWECLETHDIDLQQTAEDPLAGVLAADDEADFLRRKRAADRRLEQRAQSLRVTRRQWRALVCAHERGRSAKDRRAASDARDRVRGACERWVEEVTGAPRSLHGREVDRVLQSAGILPTPRPQPA